MSETRISKVTFDHSSIEGSPEELERAGRAIVSLLQKAADAATEKVARAVDEEQRLAAELQHSEERVKELEVQLRDAQDRADRAERWLLRIKQEVQTNFFDRAFGP
jgi:hypothetical protein